MIIVLYLGSLITEMFSVIYFVYRCDSLIESSAMCVRLAYRTQQTIQNKAELPNRTKPNYQPKPTISLLLKYSLILPNAPE